MRASHRSEGCVVDRPPLADQEGVTSLEASLAAQHRTRGRLRRHGSLELPARGTNSARVRHFGVRQSILDSCRDAQKAALP